MQSASSRQPGSYDVAMDAELKAYVDDIARGFDNRCDEVKADMRHMREQMRDVRGDMRSMRVRDLQSIGLEARVQELERRLSELEGGARS